MTVEENTKAFPDIKIIVIDPQAEYDEIKKALPDIEITVIDPQAKYDGMKRALETHSEEK